MSFRWTVFMAILNLACSIMDFCQGDFSGGLGWFTAFCWAFLLSIEKKENNKLQDYLDEEKEKEWRRGLFMQEQENCKDAYYYKEDETTES